VFDDSAGAALTAAPRLGLLGFRQGEHTSGTDHRSVTVVPYWMPVALFGAVPVFRYVRRRLTGNRSTRSCPTCGAATRGGAYCPACGGTLGEGPE
jgi:hypothetical protein